MKITPSFRLAPVASALAVAILITWCLSAVALDQSLLASQKSKLLMGLGAANGDLLHTQQWWRILASQFLHVHFLHMLFNTGCILIVGSCIEHRYGWQKLTLVYLVGGSIGQAASVISYPDLVSSGASQALMSLCGAAVVMLSRRPRVFAIAIVAIQVALDIYVAQTIKAGHSVGIVAGLLIGAAFLLLNRSQASNPEPDQSKQPTHEDARG